MVPYMNSQINQTLFALRYEAELEVCASIIGGPNDQKFTTVDVSATGIAIKALEYELPFHVGTLIEIKIPVKSKDGSEGPIELMLIGKVVRIEEDPRLPDFGKVLCGVQILDMSRKDRKVWESLVESLRESIANHPNASGNVYSQLLRMIA